MTYVLTHDNLEHFETPNLLWLAWELMYAYFSKTILQFQDSGILTEQFVAAKLQQGSE